MRVLIVSMFFCFISVMPELAVSRVKRARAWTYASRSNYRRGERGERERERERERGERKRERGERERGGHH